MEVIPRNLKILPISPSSLPCLQRARHYSNCPLSLPWLELPQSEIGCFSTILQFQLSTSAILQPWQSAGSNSRPSIIQFLQAVVHFISGRQLEQLFIPEPHSCGGWRSKYLARISLRGTPFKIGAAILGISPFTCTWDAILTCKQV